MRDVSFNSEQRVNIWVTIFTFMEDRIKNYEESIKKLHNSEIELIRIEMKRMRQTSLLIAATAMAMAFVLLF